ncbi:MAG: hypothetical protein A3B41_04030 [Candidatus Levybacteria bacterium RIFCSPLOWO2_01_FULL_37_26]|nr:MAG: hypothetical protein A3E40_03475 [Candidatus Levybacteria bacterium RIFCSPHIGHO2_12_FULL_37_9]OGH39633.1 MAG: hypothetical protein A3B41_04030 [Candidatus Levybacteria bacterium RIFCSPLOWO2_01_FULL_37_26]
MWFILVLIFFFLSVLEAITTLPLVFILLLCLYIVFERTWIFTIAFFTGLFLDLYLVRTLGQTSLYFLVFLIVILLYERKFEIKTKPFVFFVSFLGSLGYLLIFRYDYIFWQAVASAIIAVLIFQFLIRSRPVGMK